MKSSFFGAMASSLGAACLTTVALAQAPSNLLPTPSFQNWSGASYQTARLMADDGEENIPSPAPVPMAAPDAAPMQAAPSHAAPYQSPAHAAPTYSAPQHVSPAHSAPIGAGCQNCNNGAGTGHGAGAAYGHGGAAINGQSGAYVDGGQGGYVEGGYAQGGYVEGGYVEGGYAGGYDGAIDGFMSHRHGRSCWYGGVNGLIMNRVKSDDVWLSFPTGNAGAHLMGTSDAAMDWAGGVEVFLGHRLSNCWSVEAGYWGIYPSQSEANAFDPNGTPGDANDLNTTFDLTTIQYDDGAGPSAVNDWFDNAARHRLRRDFAFHNVEANMVYNPGIFCCGCGAGGYGGAGIGGLGAGAGYAGGGSRFTMNWLFGVRYMHLGEQWQFAADEADTTFTGAANELYYDIDVDNDLLGLQFGGNGNYQLSGRWSADFGAKFGVFNNHMTHSSRIGGANGAATVVAGIPNAGRAFDVRSSKDDIAFLGEMKVGMNYRVSCNCSLNFGYRAVAITGVALPGDQIPASFADIDGVSDINSDGSLILHGGYAGLEFNY